MKKWDDDMDRKLNDSLRDLKYDFDESSWEKMNEKLDEEFSKPVALVWNGRVVYVAVLLLLLPTAYIIWKQSHADNAPIAALETTTDVPELKAARDTEDFSSVAEKEPEFRSVESKTNHTPSKSGLSNLSGRPHITFNLKQPIDRVKALNEDSLDMSVAETEDNIGTNNVSYTYDSPYRQRLVSRNRITGQADAIYNSIYQQLNFDQVKLRSDQDFLTYSMFKKLEKDRRKQERDNAQEIRRKLGSHFRKTKRKKGEGKFSLEPLDWGVRIGAGFALGNRRYRINYRGGITKDIPVGLEGLNVGLYLRYVLKKRWHLQTELAYSRLRGVNQDRYFTNTPVDPFEVIRNFYLISYRLEALDLYDLQTTLQYKLPKHSTFEAGLAIGYVNPKENIYQDVSSVWDGTILKPKPSVNLPNAILKVNMQVIIGYEYTISNRVGISARGYLGLLDLSNDNFFDQPPFGEDFFEGGSRLQLSLKFNLN
ncbi:MAG: outer membrane beta-barrel protein [Cyclobacteriaceae bacterium]